MMSSDLLTQSVLNIQGYEGLGITMQQQQQQLLQQQQTDDDNVAGGGTSITAVDQP